ncbi:MAG TPA: DUF11 domain-containing protein [Rudaea sp.]|nr:DUF11 domain-containing protein [Rudaea sp.]
MTPTSRRASPRTAVSNGHSALGFFLALLLALITSSAMAQNPSADLAVAKSVGNATPNVGDVVTFTVTVNNSIGPDSATNVVLTDLLPAGLTFVSVNPSQGSYDSGTGVWTIGTITTSVAQTLTVQARVVSAAAQTNTATITAAAEFDPNTGNNSANITVTPQQADLAIAKTVSNATPNVGDIITFTLTMSNSGPDAATNVAVTDLLPAGLTFVSANPSQGSYDSLTGVWTIGTITTSVPQTLTVQARVVSAAAQTNTATITHADQFDPVTTNNSASATETPQQADLAVSKTVSNATPNVGDTITFTVTVTDNGPDSATNVTVSDVLPAGLTFVSATPSQGTYASATGVWTIGTITTAVPQTLTIQAQVVSSASQTNTATITHSDQFDPDTANNSASVTVTAASQPSDLAVTKSVNNPAPNVGDTVTFTVTVTNNGPTAATNVTLADLLPAGLTFVSATPSQGTYASATGVWTIGSIANSGSATVALNATVVSPTAQTNTAAITHGDQSDPNLANNSASATVTPLQADLAIAKTVDNPAPGVGNTVTFTVTLSNIGPDSATNVIVTDLLPAGLAFVSATPSQGTYASATGVWTAGTIATSSSASLSLAATVTQSVALTNTATITHADQFDPSTVNNTASAAIAPPVTARPLTPLPIDVRWMLGLMGLLALATLPYLRRR